MSRHDASASLAFADWIAEARAADILQEAERRGARLKRAGAEWIGPCPACGGTDRFGIHPRKGVFHCRGSGKGGDVIAMVQYLDTSDFKMACEALTGREPPSGERGVVDEAARARRAEDARAAAEGRARDGDFYRERERERAFAIWRDARPIAKDTPAAFYFDRRGLGMPRYAAFRWSADQPYFHDGNVIWRGAAVVAAIVNGTGTFIGAHLTWLDPATCGKATIADPATGELLPAKKVRGSKTGGHIALNGVERPRRLVIGEGIETVRSVAVALHGRVPREAETLYWSSVDLGNLGGRAASTVRHPTATKTGRNGRTYPLKVPGPVPDLSAERVLMPPASVTEIILLGDGDSDRFATDCALRRAAARWAGAGRTIRIAWAPDGRDFNDVLLGWPAAAVRAAGVVPA